MFDLPKWNKAWFQLDKPCIGVAEHIQSTGPSNENKWCGDWVLLIFCCDKNDGINFCIKYDSFLGSERREFVGASSSFSFDVHLVFVSF